MSLSIVTLAMLVCASLPLKVYSKNFFFNTSVTGNTNRYKWDSINKENSLDVELKPKYRSNSGITLSGYVPISKSFKGEKKWSLSDGFVQPSYPIYEYEELLSITGVGRIYGPLSEASKNDTKMITKFSVLPTFSADLSQIGATGLGLVYRPQYTYGVYEYKTSLSGKSNTLHTFTQLYGISFDFLEKFSISTSFFYSLYWTHKKNQKEDSFYWIQEASMIVNDYLSWDLGYSNQAGVKKDNGYDSNIKLTDDSSGTFYTSLTLKF
jgi:hypothetical protein